MSNRTRWQDMPVVVSFLWMVCFVAICVWGDVAVSERDTTIAELRAKEAKCEGIADDLGACARDLIESIEAYNKLVDVLQGICAADGGVADGGVADGGGL